MLPLPFISASQPETSSGTFIPSRCNRRSCHSLNLHVSHNDRFSRAPPKPSSICTVHIPSQPGNHFRRKFSVMQLTYILSSSSGFPYEKMLTYFLSFVKAKIHREKAVDCCCSHAAAGYLPK